MDNEFIICEECGDQLEISSDGCNMIGACNMWGCPHSDPELDDHPKPLCFDANPRFEEEEE